MNSGDSRLSGDDLCAYVKVFADKFLQGKIQFGVDVRGIRRGVSGKGWQLDVLRRDTSTKETREYTRVVLCTGVSNISYNHSHDVSHRFPGMQCS